MSRYCLCSVDVDVAACCDRGGN